MRNRAVIAIGVLLLVLAATWVVLRFGEDDDAAFAHRPSTLLGKGEEPENRIVPTRAPQAPAAKEEERPAPRENRCRIELRDLLRDLPLPDCSVVVGETAAVLTDGEGGLELPLLSGPQVARIELPDCFGPRDPVELHFDGPVEEGEIIVLAVPAWSGLRFDLGAVEVDRERLHYLINFLPPLESILPEDPRRKSLARHLPILQVASPPKYMEELDRLTKMDFPSQGGELTTSDEPFFLARRGSVLVRAWDDAKGSFQGEFIHQIRDLVPGKVIAVRPCPQTLFPVSGRVIDAQGGFVVGAEIRLQCIWTFTEDNPPPSGWDRGGGCTLRSEKGRPGVDVTLRKYLKTDYDGRFAIDMPFSGDVAVTVRQPGFRLTTAEILGKGPYEPREEILITLPPRGDAPSSFIRFIDEEGQAVTGVQVGLIWQSDSGRFQHNTQFETDSRGTIDVSELELGRPYSFHVSQDRGPHRRTTFFDGGIGDLTLEKDQVITLRRPERN